MMCYLHYFSALRRLHESEKSVTMLGGEREAPEMVRAQRDFIKLEKEYYAEECVSWNFGIAFACVIAFIMFVIYNVKGV